MDIQQVNTVLAMRRAQLAAGTGKNTIRDNWNTIAGHEAIAAAAGIYGA